MKTIYLDNAASMPMSAKVIKEVDNANKKYYANPGSLHGLGIEAKKVLNQARKELALELGVKAEEILFTSGGSESNALAIIGAAREQKKSGKNKIVISAIEHSSVYENARALEKEGFIVREIPVNESDGIDFGSFQREIDDKTGIVSVMSVNSETGILNDVSRVAKICKQKGVLLHVDHLQGFGKIPLQVKTVGIDLLSAGGHKIGGPKGIGLLYIRNGVKIEPLTHGGEQERGYRSGTENVSGALGFNTALKEYKKTNWKNVSASRDLLEVELESLGARITAKQLPRSPAHLHVCFENISGEDIVTYLSTKGIYCSTGSACDSEKKEKRILQRLGVGEKFHHGAVRFSLAPNTTKRDVLEVVKQIRLFLNRFKNAQK